MAENMHTSRIMLPFPHNDHSSRDFRTGGPVRITEQQSAYTSPRRDLDLYAV